MVYKTCLSQFDSHMHEAQVRGEGLGGRSAGGAYLHCTATTPFETVCKQFINGSVPFGYSLNSGFDTGNDSWFSSGAWQVGTPVQKNACRLQVFCGWERAGWPRGLGYHFQLGLALWEEEEKKKSLCTHQKSWGGKRGLAFTIRGCGTPSFRRALSTCTR